MWIQIQRHPACLYPGNFSDKIHKIIEESSCFREYHCPAQGIMNQMRIAAQYLIDRRPRLGIHHAPTGSEMGDGSARWLNQLCVSLERFEPPGNPEWAATIKIPSRRHKCRESTGL